MCRRFLCAEVVTRKLQQLREISNICHRGTIRALTDSSLLNSLAHCNMTSVRPFQMTDLFDTNPVNLDTLTENFNPLFYSQYLTEWPLLFFKSVEICSWNNSSSNQDDLLMLGNREISGYMMGKTEGQLSKKEWHTHITAVTVNPQYRRLGLALFLCNHLENATSGEPYKTLFIDLFVKANNVLARIMYEKLGYSVYRRVVGYYGKEMPQDRNKIDDEIDAFDMRKSLPCDINRETVRENGHKVNVLPYEIVF